MRDREYRGKHTWIEFLIVAWRGVFNGNGKERDYHDNTRLSTILIFCGRLRMLCINSSPLFDRCLLWILPWRRKRKDGRNRITRGV